MACGPFSSRNQIVVDFRVTRMRAAARSGDGNLPRVFADHGRNNFPVGQNAEEFLAARVAAIGGKAKKALQKDQCACIDALARNMLQIKVSATGAVRIARKRNGHRPGVKSLVAGPATPGPQPEQGGGEISHAPAMRAETFCAAALRANHYDACMIPGLGRAKHIQNDFSPQ